MAFAAVYWFKRSSETPDGYTHLYVNSISSLRDHDKSIRVILAGPDKMDFPFEELDVEWVRQPATIDERRASCGVMTTQYSIFDLDLSGFERVMFLDPDTLIFQNLTKVMERYEDQFTGRMETGVIDGSVQKANRMLHVLGLRMYKNPLFTQAIPRFINSGVFVFNPTIQKRLAQGVKKFAYDSFRSPYLASREGIQGQIEVTEFIDEINFTRGILESGVPISRLDEKDNAFYWEGEPVENARILHTSSMLYSHFLERWPNMDRNRRT